MLKAQSISIFSISYWLFYEDFQHITDLSFAGANSFQLGERTELSSLCLYLLQQRKLGGIESIYVQ